MIDQSNQIPRQRCICPSHWPAKVHQELKQAWYFAYKCNYMEDKLVKSLPIEPAHKTAKNDNHKGNFGVETVDKAEYPVEPVDPD